MVSDMIGPKFSSNFSYARRHAFHFEITNSQRDRENSVNFVYFKKLLFSNETEYEIRINLIGILQIMRIVQWKLKIN